MNTKRVFALLLLLAMILVLLPVRAAKAEECPECGDPLVAKYADVDGHIWVCSRGCGYEQYQDHTLDKNCWCSVCEHYCHDLKTIGCDVHTQPTCTEPGLDYDGLLYICLRCGQYMDDGETPVNPVTAPALGHDLQSVPAKAPTCMEVGWEAYASCSCCEYKENYFEIPVDPNNHAWDTEWTWDDKEHWHPCNNEGCEAKLDAEAHTARKPEIEPGKPATCTEEGTTDATFCSVCGAPISEQEIIEPLGHLLTPVAKVEPSCTTPGTEAYWKCTRDGCGKLFSDAGGKNEITAPVAIEALGHSPVAVAGKEPTCTETGLTEGSKCSLCGEVLKEQETIDALGHTPVAVAGKEPTCTETGLTEGSKCSLCGEVLKEQETIDALGHTPVAVAGKEPTCTETGLTEGSKCSLCGEVLKEQETIDALGHFPVAVAGKEPTCTETGLTEGSKCSLCGEVLKEQETINALGHTPVAVAGKDATCTEAGLTEGSKCSLCGEVLKEQEAIDALGHSPVAVAGKDATCTEAGLTEGSKCSVCGEVLKEQETIDALGHTPVAVAGKDATCTEAGLTEGSKCSLCGEVLEEQETIDPLGHMWGEWAVAFSPQVGNPGVKIRVCDRCEECEQKEIEPLPEPAPKPEPKPKPKPVPGPEPAPAPRPQPELPFTDVTKDMDIYDDVKYVYEKGIMDGVSATLFGPELSLTRGMIATILYRIEGKPKAPYSGVFSDVPAGQWYTDGVEWAASVGLVLGYGDGTYGATDNVTREQLAAILYRYAVWKGYAVKTAALKAEDAEDVSDFAVEAMGWAVASGILRPDGDGNIRSGADATRGEIATAIHAFLENMAR